MHIDERHVVAWEMSAEERAHLESLPEIVDLYCALAREGKDVYYLTREDGQAGVRAMARVSGIARLERLVVRRELIIAVDLARMAAQVALLTLGMDSLP